jgi:hypothetical protein
MKPSTPSLTPATTKATKAKENSLEIISHTVMGTRRMRPMVMKFGRFMGFTGGIE